MSDTAPLPDYAATSRLLSRKQAMQFLDISHGLLAKLTKHANPDKRIPSYKVAGSRKYRYDELIWWLEKQRT